MILNNSVANLLIVFWKNTIINNKETEKMRLNLQPALCLYLFIHNLHKLLKHTSHIPVLFTFLLETDSLGYLVH